MGNMSYCRFENTNNDLEDCYEALSEASSLKELMEDAGSYEANAMQNLIGLCETIAREFGEETEYSVEED